MRAERTDVSHVGHAIPGEVFHRDVHGATMPRRARLCFAPVAIRFASLAEPLGGADPPRGGAHPEPALERAREGRRRRKPVIEGDDENALITMMDQGERGPLEPEPLDERGQRLARHRAEDAVKMEWGEGGDRREAFEKKLLGEMVPDVIDDAIDPLLV